MSEEEEVKPKPSGMKGTILLFLILAVFSGAVGWGLANGLISSPSSKKQAEKVHKTKTNTDYANKPDDDEHDAHDEDDEHEEPEPTFAFVKLEPVIVNLAKPENTLIRVELGVSVLQNTVPLQNFDTAILIDVLAGFLRTIDYAQYEGPSGYQHFREDILQRFDMASNGHVNAIYVSALVIE